MKLLVFIGPSGSGKTTLIRELDSREVISVTPSWTTRPRRADEIEGSIDHRFVSREQFTRLRDDGFFLEVVEMFGHDYGLPRIGQPRSGAKPAISIRASHLGLVSKHYPDHLVYQIESSRENARARIATRNEPRADADMRIKSYSEEIDLGRKTSTREFDTSGSLKRVLAEVERAISEDFPAERTLR
ncbi:MAG TPA: hypothetical protein VFA00_04695 [Actinomycetota bacterium]|jgi:guanylate kinase|nr:hypothetical protein [Actinomycetota bacterium]